MSWQAGAQGEFRPASKPPGVAPSRALDVRLGFGKLPSAHRESLLDHFCKRSPPWVGGASSGQAIVEIAVCLPFLLLIVTGIWSFGWALSNYLQLTDAVSAGARAVASHRGKTDAADVPDPCAIAYAAATDAAPSLVQQGGLVFQTAMFSPLTAGGGGGTQEPGSPFVGPSCSSSSTSTGAAGDLVQNGSVTLTVTFPCNLQVYGYNFYPSCILQAQMTEIVQ